MAEVSLTIGGRAYRLACRDGEEERLRLLGRLVDARATDAIRAVGRGNEPRELLLTALLLADELDEMRGALTEHGFMEYLPLRFARAGKEDRFAQMAAAGVPQIGFGLGAITRIDGAESVNTRDLARYCAAEGDFAKITEEVRKTR